MIKTKLLVPAVALFALAGCQTNGDMYRSDVYGSNQVNQAQQVQTVEIIAIQPARVGELMRGRIIINSTGATFSLV